MDILLLRTLHVAGVIGLFTSMGAIISSADADCKKKASILHGISLLMIAGIGFAMLKKPPMGQYWWMVKFGMWLFLGVAPVLAKRNVLPRPALLLLCIASGIFAAWLGLTKPF